MSNERLDIGAVAGSDSYSGLIKEIERNFNPNNNTVLLVDDERGIRKRVARDVQAFDKNIVIYEASNGQEALQKLAQIRTTHSRDPLFIVLDLNMPIMDGWQVIKELKKDYESQGKEIGIPIIVLSSTSGEKGIFLTKSSVHDGKSGYNPLVSIAKEACIDKTKYDTSEKGLVVWLKHFIKAGH